MHFLDECTWFDVRNLNHQLCCIFCLSQIWTRKRMTSFLRFFFFCVFFWHTSLLQTIFELETFENEFFLLFLFCEVCIVYTVYYIWHDTKVRDETKNEQGSPPHGCSFWNVPCNYRVTSNPWACATWSRHRQQLCSDLKEGWLWIRPNPWLPKALMHWFLGTQSSALVSSSRRGGVVFFNQDTGGPPRSKSCNTPKTHTNNTKSHTPNTVSVPHTLSTALINTSMKFMFIQQMGKK